MRTKAEAEIDVPAGGLGHTSRGAPSGSRHLPYAAGVGVVFCHDESEGGAGENGSPEEALRLGDVVENHVKVGSFVGFPVAQRG